MEATPPSAPQLLLPPGGARLGLFGPEAPQLDWSDVTDPSGVSYTVQVAEAADFSRLVVVKGGLKRSEYALSEAEALGVGNYYWRVKAIDGVGNESKWSVPSQFRVGAFPSWLPLGTLITLVVMVLMVIGAVVYMARRPQI
jgi:hypothetical protein